MMYIFAPVLPVFSSKVSYTKSSLTGQFGFHVYLIFSCFFLYNFFVFAIQIFQLWNKELLDFT